MAWTPYPDKNTPNPVTLPEGWVECDGRAITEGIWAGHTTPDLNKSQRFLRGGIVGNALEMEEDTTAGEWLAALLVQFCLDLLGCFGHNNKQSELLK